jgi:Protein of unknown function (DUF2917)
MPSMHARRAKRSFVTNIPINQNRFIPESNWPTRLECNMKTNQVTRFPLKKGEVITMTKPKDCVIQVDSGRLWITQTNQNDDVFIEAGNACTPKENGFLVAEAMSHTVMSMKYVKPGSAHAENDNNAPSNISLEGA